jgi:hypothetical protein
VDPTLRFSAPIAAPLATFARPDAACEQARRRIVNVVLLIYLLAIFEGSIRKYIAPQFGQYIFFVRDPFLLYVYAVATRYALWPRNQPFLYLSVAMCGFGVVLFGMQSAVAGIDSTRVLLGVYGWRSYFLYVPLAFLIGAQFDAADLRRFARVTLLLTVPIAVLVVAQFSSPPNAAVNVGVAAEEELQFKSVGLNMERIRTTGPFTSNAGQQQFVTTAFALLLAGLLRPTAQRGIGSVLLLAAAAATFTCVALSGSRGTMLQCGLIAAVALLLGAIGRGAALKSKALLVPFVVVGAAAVLYPIVFPIGFDTFVARWNSAALAESGFGGGVFGRAGYGFIDFIRLIALVPALGYGLGYGGNASITLRATVDGMMPGLLSETDFSRHMVDLGATFGICYIGFRFAFVSWLFGRVWRATRSSADPLPMMLFAYAGYVVLSGQISGHGTINVYAWLFTGLCLAAVRVSLQRGPVRPAGVELPARPRLAAARHHATRRSVLYPLRNSPR